MQFSCIAQRNKEVLSHIPSSGRSIRDFIPEGYDTLAVATDDFNKDGKPDMVLVLNDKTEKDPGAYGNGISKPDRCVVVIFKTAKRFRLVAKSTDLIPGIESGGLKGDPFTKITATKGVISITLTGVSTETWVATRDFRYQDNNFYLAHKSNVNIYKAAYCDKLGEAPGRIEDINMVTGDRYQKTVTRECKLLIDKKDKIEVNPLIKLADYNYEN